MQATLSRPTDCSAYSYAYYDTEPSRRPRFVRARTNPRSYQWRGVGKIPRFWILAEWLNAVRELWFGKKEPMHIQTARQGETPWTKLNRLPGWEQPPGTAQLYVSISWNLRVPEQPCYQRGTRYHGKSMRRHRLVSEEDPQATESGTRVSSECLQI